MQFTKNAQRWLEVALDDLTFPDSWRRGAFTDFETWRRHARARLAEALGPVPAETPLDVEILDEEDRGTYTATHLSFQVDPAFRTRAYLLMPQGTGRVPGILALHDHGGFFRWGKEKLVRSPVADHPALAEFRRLYYGDRFPADELARRGYAVMVIDQWLWGEQRLSDVPGAQELDLTTYEGVHAYNTLVQELVRRISYALVFAGCTLPGQMVYADRRSLDLLLQNPRVDPARIGCIGLSVGGFRSVYLAAMDERIQAAVEVGWMCALGTYLRYHDHLYHHPSAMGLCVPALTRSLDFPDVASLACPRPFLLMAGRQDSLYPIEGVEEAFAKIRSVYADGGVPERVETRWYDVPHCFDVAMQEEAFAWLDRWLQG